MLKEFFQRESTKKLIYFIILIVLLYSVKSMFNLFLLTFLFAYFVDTIQDFILKRTSDFIKISPKVVTVIIYCFIAVLIVFAIDRYIPLAVNQGVALMKHISNLEFTDYQYINEIIQQVDIAKYAKMATDNLVTWATNIGKWVFDIFMALILSLFFVLEKERIKKFMNKFNESKIASFYKYTVYLGNSFLNSFGKVIQAQILIALVNTGISVVGLTVIGFKSLVAIGAMIFVLSLIPVAGVIISLIPICLMAFEIGGIIKIVYVLIMVAIIHAFESYVLNPKLMSNKTNLPVFFTFMILIVSESLMGTWGLLLGIPIVIFILDMLGMDLNDNRV